jgi:hypothetical protein
MTVSCHRQQLMCLVEFRDLNESLTTDTFWTYNLKIPSDDLDDRFVDFIPIRSRYMKISN